MIERSGYGYELLKRFERSYGPTLPIKSDWHIYRALNGLREKGLVEEIPVDDLAQESAGRQPKPHYRATCDGFSLYRDWLIAQAPPQRSSSLLVRHLAALARRPRVALEIIDHYERAFLTEAEQVTSAEGRLHRGAGAHACGSPRDQGGPPGKCRQHFVARICSGRVSCPRGQYWRAG